MKSSNNFIICIFILFVLAMSVILTSCKSMNDAPITYLYVIDIQHGVCSQREITDKNTLSSKFVADLPLSSCDGNVSLTMQEFLNLRTFMKGNKK